MIYTGKMMKLRTSLAIIIPKDLVEKLKIYKGQIMIIKEKRGKIELSALDDKLDKKDKGDNNGQY